jgi:hypothetical protein
VVHRNEVAKSLDKIVCNNLIVFGCWLGRSGPVPGASPVSSKATKTSSMLGTATATSEINTPATRIASRS